jgi:hypothetical protein
MTPGKQPLRSFLLVLVVCGCSASPPPTGVVRFDPRNIPKDVEGPFPNFGPFDTRWDALLAACPLILSQPNATAGRTDDMNFDVRWRASEEYCAWLYYTPADKYEMSMLVESSEPIRNSHERICRAPAFVNDKRYPQSSLKHLYFLHNHPAFPTNLSELDIAALARIAQIHGGFVETKEGRIPVSIIAFISTSYPPQPASCDGFYEYSHGSTEVFKWLPDEHGQWRKSLAGTITWSSETQFHFFPAR